MSSYPTPDSGSIRNIALSPFSESNPNEAFALFLDETNRVSICDISSSNNSTPTLNLTTSFPLSASARAATWCPFVSSQLDQTDDDIHCLVTAAVGCPIQLRYFSNISNKEKYPDVEPHDPSWVEGSYKCYDDLEYLIAANALCWHRSRKGQLICGFDKGYLGIFDIERPGRDLAWRQQVNSICAFQNSTSHNRKITNPQHAVSAVAVHETRPDLIACGTRSGLMPVWDSRMKLPACVLRCQQQSCDENNNNSLSLAAGHAYSAGITDIKFDPTNEFLVYSTSRGRGVLNKDKNCHQTGVVQHDLRKPQVASGMMITSSTPIQQQQQQDSNTSSTATSTMQPIHFDFVTSSALRNRILGSSFFSSSSSSSQTANNNNSSITILSGCPTANKVILGNGINSNQSNSLVGGDSKSSSSSATPVTAVAVCNKRNIAIVGGGGRNYHEPHEDEEDFGKIEAGKIRPRDLPKQASSSFVMKF